MTYLQLTKRNTLIYLRQKGAVFFSLLTMLIIVMLMVLFLGEMNINAIVDNLALLPGRDADTDRENATALVLLWTLAGIITVNAVNVTNAVYSTMVNDRVDGRLNSIYTAPVSRMTIAASYVSAAWLCSVMICTATLAVTDIVCAWSGVGIFSFATHLELMGLIALNSFVVAAIMYCLAMVVRSPGAFSGIGTVIGTLVGFLGGIYLPIGSLSDGVAAALKCTPIIYGTALFRHVMTRDVWNATFDGVPEEIPTAFARELGIELYVFDRAVSPAVCAAILLVCGAVFLLAGGLLTKHYKKSDR